LLRAKEHCRFVVVMGAVKRRLSDIESHFERFAMDT
jgi:hypothetical protein